MTPENKVKNEVNKVLSALGAYYAPIVAGERSISGIPDILCCISGRFVAIETKATGKDKPTVLQAKHLYSIHDAGGIALVIDIDNIAALLDTLELRAHPLPSMLRWTEVNARRIS